MNKMGVTVMEDHGCAKCFALIEYYTQCMHRSQPIASVELCLWNCPAGVSFLRRLVFRGYDEEFLVSRRLVHQVEF